MRIGSLASISVVLGTTLLLVQACGNGNAPPPPTITSVSVTPSNPTIMFGQSQQFHAAVTGTGSFGSTVTWYVNDIAGGNSGFGTISATGMYTAPAFVNADFAVMVKAISAADTSKSGTTQANLVAGIVSGVSIDPVNPDVYAGSQQIFTANVHGTGSVNPNVTWTVNGIPGGNSTVGTIGTGPSAFYTAPNAIPSPDAVTLTATSLEDPTKSISTSVRVIPPPLGIISVSVTPTSVNMPESQTQTFTVTVVGVGSFDPSVTWTPGPAGIILPDYGRVSAAGVYTPPANLTDTTPINIIVTSVADPSKSATAFVQVLPPPVITEIRPNPANAGDTVDVLGTNLNNVTAIHFAGPNGVTLTVPTFGTGIPVPFSAVSGPISVETQLPGFAPVVSNSLQFRRTPDLRIRAAHRDLSSGETTKIFYRILGMASGQPINWTADVGSIDGNGNYKAPSGLSSDSFAHIQGCISGTQICQSEIVGLHPFRITPYPASAPLGGSVQLETLVGGAQQSGAAWSNLSTHGSITPGGLYTATSGATDGGGIPVSAELNGVTESATVAVTGASPGVVSEVSDYVDYTLPLPLGTYNEQVAVSGNHLYALASGTLGGYYERTYFWIDVYDISDPIHPVWLDAVETALRGPMYARGQYLYQLGAGIVAVFDISAVKPVLIEEATAPALNNANYFDGILWGVKSYSDAHDQVSLAEFDLRNGSVAEHDYQLPLPSGAGPDTGVSSTPMGSDTRLFLRNTVLFSGIDSSTELDTYDLTTNPPTLLQAMPFPPTLFSTMSFQGNFLIFGGKIFDVTSGIPVEAADLPPIATGFPYGFNGTQLLTGTGQNGFRVTDLTDLTRPRLTGVLYDATAAFETAVWAGQYVITANIGLRVFDAGPAGGAIDKAVPLSGFLDAATYDQLIYQSHLYEAVGTDRNAFVSILDLTANPLVELGRFDTGAATPLAVQASGNSLYAGTDQSLLVLDISDPANPAQINSIRGKINTLAVLGNFLYAGTGDGHLSVFDISQPQTPVQVSSQAIAGPPIFIHVSNNLLFIADDLNGLLTYSLANPLLPTLLSQFQAGTAVGDVAIDGNLALLATYDQGLVILDMTNPSQPVQTGQALVPAYGYTLASAIAGGITLTNKTAYVGTWFDGGNVYGFDYSFPSHPRLVAVMPEGGVLDDVVLTLQNNGTDLFLGGDLDGRPLIDVDITQATNVINFYPLFASAISSAAAKRNPDPGAKVSKKTRPKLGRPSHYGAIRVAPARRK